MRRIYYIIPPHTHAETPADEDTSSISPHGSELSDSDWIEVSDREYTDEDLMDDARPGRRKRENSRSKGGYLRKLDSCVCRGSIRWINGKVGQEDRFGDEIEDKKGMI
ncbi:hypothetical protein FB567DRAFT_542848 [Paraphoma chrysanthemicola]|uniref:Uncharacterized protein n=1 Tax=Paraphoma chrysanthemicola TaxID=798071 RepID=A0A8K0RJ94_9PLEO|nr:hypothetical protein FB567DRAFT_542848 [Paraphoma chrysanthemicola]